MQAAHVMADRLRAQEEEEENEEKVQAEKALHLQHVTSPIPPPRQALHPPSAYVVPGFPASTYPPHLSFHASARQDCSPPADPRGAVRNPISPVYYHRPAPVMAVHAPAVGAPMHARSHSAAPMPMQPIRPVAAASRMDGGDDHRKTPSPLVDTLWRMLDNDQKQLVMSLNPKLAQASWRMLHRRAVCLSSVRRLRLEEAASRASWRMLHCRAVCLSSVRQLRLEEAASRAASPMDSKRAATLEVCQSVGTAQCKQYMKNKCRYGNRCRYSHSKREERSIRRIPMEEKKTELPVIQQQTSDFVPPVPRETKCRVSQMRGKSPRDRLPVSKLPRGELKDKPLPRSRSTLKGDITLK